MSDPGFDFIKLTKAQWKHLKRIERDHGIPWFHYIQTLVQADMDGRLKGVPKEKKKKRKKRPDDLTDWMAKMTGKIDELMSRPVVQYGPATNMVKADVTPKIDNDPTSKVTELVPLTAKELADLKASANPMIDEMRAKFGLPSLAEDRARKKKERDEAIAARRAADEAANSINIQFSDHVDITPPKPNSDHVAPPPPPVVD